MPITAAQLEKRKERLGSSDMAAILGFDSFRNAHDVWLEKTDKLEPETKQSDAMRMGTLLEPAVLQYAEEELGKLTRNQFRSAKDLGFPLGANIDAIVISTGEPVEAKTSGLQSGVPYGEWGDPLTDQVPDRVIVQAMVHLICLVEVKEVCHVPALLGGRGFTRYIVPRDQDVIDTIAEEGHKFWNNHVLADVPPTNLTPSLAVVKRVRREPNKTVDVDASLVNQWQLFAAAESEAKKGKEKCLAEILATIGDAEAAVCDLGKFTYLEQSRGSYTVEPTTFRVPRFKKNK